VNSVPTRENPSSQSDSSFEDPVYPVGNAKTPIAIVIVDFIAIFVQSYFPYLEMHP
jgi:hypothetical protein